MDPSAARDGHRSRTVAVDRPGGATDHLEHRMLVGLIAVLLTAAISLVGAKFGGEAGAATAPPATSPTHPT